jgi:hypothetical protein
MKLRNLKTQEQCSASRFNMNSICEIEVHLLDEIISDYPSNYEFWLEAEQCWMSWQEAKSKHLIITDNYNSCFFEPDNEEDKQRGYTLD